MKRLSHILLLLALLILVPACRQANSQTTIVQTVDDPQQWTRNLPLPAPLSNRPEQILTRKAYVVSYNKDTRQPNWVAWRLTAAHTDGPVPRPMTAWHDDKEVPQPRAYYQDYRGTRWDRGHMCPAGDNKWDSTAMYESFLMTNACPQDKALNSGVWNQIEMDCRQWARRYGEIVIVCGPIFLNGEHDSIGEHCIPVPDAFFKVIADLNPEHPKGIGYICRNNEGQKKRDIYTNSISEVERITGISFFPDLPETLRASVKDSKGKF